MLQHMLLKYSEEVDGCGQNVSEKLPEKAEIRERSWQWLSSEVEGKHFRQNTSSEGLMWRQSGSDSVLATEWSKWLHNVGKMELNEMLVLGWRNHLAQS